jgi:hypothetical protein
MSEFWVPSMKQECERIVRPEKGKSLGRRRTGPATETKRGRVWVCCVSCAGVTVSWEPEGTDRGQGEVRVDSNGFAVTICGKCERREGRVVGIGEQGWMRICKEMIAGSAVWRGISEHCISKGWGELEVRSERVVDRRVLFGKEVEGMRVASVRIEEEEEGVKVKVLEYMEAGFL